jgi:multiple sugar transport system permease protein
MFPQQFVFTNYGDAFSYSNNLFVQTLVNSLVVGVFSTAISLVLTILAAYAFARMNFKGKNLLFTLLLMTMMIPGELFTTTNYVTTMRDFRWGDTFTIMIVPFLVSVYYIYLLRNAFMQIPDTLYKAAKVDGCNDMKFLVKVMIPLAGPTIISITILKLIGIWNSYMWPQLTNTQEWRLVSNWMASCGITSEGTNYPMKMAAAVIVSIPLFIVFVFFRKYIMKGVSRSGTKG